MSSSCYAVLLMAFGGPESTDGIEAFLEKIMAGRKPTAGQVETIRERYNRIGGKSPLNEITRQQALALRERIKKGGGAQAEVFVGMRYWTPTIQDTLNEITKSGINNIIAVIMAPQSSGFTIGGYRKELRQAVDNLDRKPNISLVTDCYANSHYLKAVAQTVKEGLSSFTAGKTAVIFSAHSLPLRYMAEDDSYQEQVKKTIDGVLSLTGPLNWTLGYQSKGMVPGEWLGPPVDSVLKRLPGEGCDNVLIVPIGFVADHVETLYDIDIDYRQKAESLALKFRRTTSLNDSPGYIEALYEIVLERMNKARG